MLAGLLKLMERNTMNHMDLKYLLGMKEDSALRVLDSADFVYRVMRRDSVLSMGSSNLDLERVNLEIDDGKVTSAYYG